VLHAGRGLTSSSYCPMLPLHRLGGSPAMNYWPDLFTGTTWDEFRQAGTRVSGFRATTRGVAQLVKPGDIPCSATLSGVMRWVSAAGYMRIPFILEARREGRGHPQTWDRCVAAPGLSQSDCGILQGLVT
jgi:hypothetical protein